MSEPMLHSLHGHLAEVAEQDQVRVIVITGTGSSFCSGADLRGATNPGDRDFARRSASQLSTLLQTIASHPKVIIARVQGHVSGGGNGIVAACDIALAAHTSTFAFSEVRVGVAPAVISVACLPRMSQRRAAELMLTGARISADEALEAGLVTRVCRAEDLESELQHLLEQLEKGGPHALLATKRLLREVPTLPTSLAYEQMVEVSGDLFVSEEAQAGMRAFLERTPPPWLAGQK